MHRPPPIDSSLPSEPPRGGPEPGAAPNPHFERLGGEQTIRRLVERFYHHMDGLPEASAVRALHPADLNDVKGVLTRYLVQWMGGPARHSAERGHPRLRSRHQPFSIGMRERDAWMACMRRALHDVVTDVPLRRELESRFCEVADFMRNRAEPGSDSAQ